jgi:hypothetical protein
MISYGTRSKLIGTETIFEKCPSCEKQTSFDIYIYQKYFHIFWIPFFPLERTVASQCSNCKQVAQSKNMTGAFKTACESVKRNGKTPIWMFSGLGLVAIIIVWAIVADQQETKDQARYIQSPKVGDIFEVKVKEQSYTIYKVDAVTNDSVYVLMNDYETDERTGFDHLEDTKKNNYPEDSYGYSKVEIRQMMDSGIILKVVRK